MLDRDEVAGVVDQFGALDREELDRALSELAFRQGEDLADDERADLVDEAVESYALVPVDREDRTLLVPGPAAFPAHVAGSEDLPHIMDVQPRSIDREAAAEAAAERFREDLADALGDGDRERCERLLDLSYEIESWGPVSLADERERLDERLDG